MHALPPHVNTRTQGHVHLHADTCIYTQVHVYLHAHAHALLGKACARTRKKALAADGKVELK